MGSFSRQLDVEQRGDDFILKYCLEATAQPLQKRPIFTIQELAKPEDEKTAMYARVQYATVPTNDPQKYGFEWKLNEATLHIKIHVYSDLADNQVDDPKLGTFLWEDPEDLTSTGLLNKGLTKVRVWPAPADPTKPTAAAAGPTPGSSQRMLSVFHSARRVMEEGFKAYKGPPSPAPWASGNKSLPGSDLVDRIQKSCGMSGQEWCGMFVGYSYGRAGFDLMGKTDLLQKEFGSKGLPR